MHLKPFAVVAAWAALGCSLTHSLDDLKGGSLSASGGAGVGAGTAGSANNGGADAGGSSGIGVTSGSGGAQTGGGGGTGGDTSMPTGLAIVSPVDGGTVGWMSVSVQFSDFMDETTVSVPSGTVCSKSTIQLSNDNFVSCLPMGAPSWNADDSIVTFAPSTRLTVGAQYQLRVTKGAKTQTMDSLSAAYTATATAVYSHTVDITQPTPFLDPEEKLDTSTLSQYKLYLAWDAQNLYLGMSGANINGLDQASVVLLAYFGTVGGKGAMSGMAVGPQTATFDFPSNYGIEWLGTDQETALSVLGNASGAAGAWDATALPGNDKARLNALVKLKIPFNSIGDPTDTLNFASGLLFNDPSNPGTASTYAMTPIGAFSAAGYQQLDLTGHTLPSESPTLTN